MQSPHLHKPQGAKFSSRPTSSSSRAANQYLPCQMYLEQEKPRNTSALHIPTSQHIPCGSLHVCAQTLDLYAEPQTLYLPSENIMTIQYALNPATQRPLNPLQAVIPSQSLCHITLTCPRSSPSTSRDHRLNRTLVQPPAADTQSHLGSQINRRDGMLLPLSGSGGEKGCF